MTLRTTGTVRSNGSGMQIYLPIAISMDSAFPFEEGDEVTIEISERGLDIREVHK